MPYLDIQRDFVDGVHEIFTTLFNNTEFQDGVFYYQLSEDRETNVYGEKKYKTYKAPKLLVCKAIINPVYGEQTVKEITDQAEFVVDVKSLHNVGLSDTPEAIAEMRKGIMKFHDVFYVIDNIVPKAYVEDKFLMYRFICTEDKEQEPLLIEVVEDAIDEEQSLQGEDPEE